MKLIIHIGGKIVSEALLAHCSHSFVTSELVSGFSDFNFEEWVSLWLLSKADMPIDLHGWSDVTFMYGAVMNLYTWVQNHVSFPNPAHLPLLMSV